MATDGIDLLPDLDAAACRALACRNADAYAAYLDRLDADALAETPTCRTSAGAMYENSVADVLDHVLIHASITGGRPTRPSAPPAPRRPTST